MPLFCYVHRLGGGVPYFEVLPEMPYEQATRRAGQLLAERADGERAELWRDEELVVTLRAPIAAAD